MPENIEPKTDSVVVVAQAAKAVAELFVGSKSLFSIGFHLEEKATTLEQAKTELVANLVAAGIDPVLFDTLLSNEIDRRLKTRFGITFVVLTFIFTVGSYAIVVLNGPMKLDIPTTAITGLIIETPIQFVGLLYIIARNLFPYSQRGPSPRVRLPRRPVRPSSAASARE